MSLKWVWIRLKIDSNWVKRFPCQHVWNVVFSNSFYKIHVHSFFVYFLKSAPYCSKLEFYRLCQKPICTLISSKMLDSPRLTMFAFSKKWIYTKSRRLIFIFLKTQVPFWENWNWILKIRLWKRFLRFLKLILKKLSSWMLSMKIIPLSFSFATILPLTEPKRLWLTESFPRNA